MTIIPWSRVQLLVWDATCCDIFAASHIRAAVSEPGAVAAKAEENKVSKYCHLDAVISLCQWRWKHAVLSGLK